MSKKIKFKKHFDDVIGIKKPAMDGDAGYDIYSYEDIIVPAHGSAAIKTGFSIELPIGYWFEIMPKSGLATKFNLSVHNGVIDNGYRGEIIILMYNHGNNDYKFSKNDKIAQGIIRELISFELEEAKELSDTSRGEKGFGSTGK